jgi:surfactin synthase thioesterase subunit
MPFAELWGLRFYFERAGCGGHHDGLATPANMERLSSRIPNAELEFFDGGHAFLLQDASAWLRIMEFLAGDLPGEAL